MILAENSVKHKVQLVIFLFGAIFLGRSQTAPKEQKFDAAVEVGIFYYEEEKAIKKIKIKAKKLKYGVKREIIAYNSKIKEISFLKNAELKEVTSIVNAANTPSDRAVIDEIRTRIHKVMNPIKDSIKSFETRLNANLEKQLSQKQYKNWLKYQRRKKREMAPKPPEVQRRNPAPTMRRMGQRRRY